jgi:putative SOS response-associated peptidase YedK
MDIKKLARKFNANIKLGAYSSFMAMRELEKETSVDELKEQFGLKRKPSSELLKIPGDDKNIYPNYFTHVMTLEKKKRLFEPMRYRVRPKGSTEEIPTKYNVFNARLDSLSKRDTWVNLFQSNHGLFPFTRFYERVEHNGRNRLISFRPNNAEVMWAPCLWDEWISPNGKFRFKSFALITDDPPKEVEEMGHDRCPIFLNHHHIDQWLDAKRYSGGDHFGMLKHQEETKFVYEWMD